MSIRLRLAHFVLFGVALFSLSALTLFHVNYSWHDQQRVAQVCLILAFLPLTVMAAGRGFVVCLIFFSLLGLCSSFSAEYRFWAFREWALVVGLLCFALVVSQFLQEERYQYFAMYLVGITGFVLSVQFFSTYMGLLFSGANVFSRFELFSGFGNPRFLGQFQVLLIPILLGLGFKFLERNAIVSFLCAIVLVVSWCMVAASGGRGVFVFVLFAHVLLVCVKRSYIVFLWAQLLAAMLGLLLYCFMFHVVTDWYGIEGVGATLLREGDSGRLAIWSSAVDMWRVHPWLGAGPMSFAAGVIATAAHPHQVFLQLLAEWGGMAALIIFGLSVWGGVRASVFIRNNANSPIDAALWASLIGAFGLAQVDGVFVMPYAQTWFSILVGVAISRWSVAREVGRYHRIIIGVIVFFVLIVLCDVLVRDAFGLVDIREQLRLEHPAGWRIRFWEYGWISWY